MSKGKKVVLLILMLFWIAWIIAGIVALTFFVMRSNATGNDTYIKEEYQTYCKQIGKMYNIQPEFIESFIEAESSGNPNAQNGNCIGLMQVYGTVHQDRMRRLGVTNLYDPYQNILVGTDILVDLYEQYGDDTALVVALYNGQSDAKRRTENFDFADYTKKVLNRTYELETIHHKHDIPIKEKRAK